MIKKKYYLLLFLLIGISLVWASKPTEINPEWTITNIKENTLDVVNNLLVGKGHITGHITIGCEEVMLEKIEVYFKEVHFPNGSIGEELAEKKIPYPTCIAKTHYVIIGDEKIKYERNNWGMHIEENCIILDAISDDGYPDGICQSGESCVKKCLEFGNVINYYRNSEEGFDKTKGSYKGELEVISVAK